MHFAIPQHYSDELSFELQLIYALSKLKKGSVNEIAIELMELKGISTEDGVAELTLCTEREIEKLCNNGAVRAVKEKHEKKRYELTAT